MARKTPITGQKNTMNNGLTCVVIEDFGANNITVQFEDGTIVEHRTRNCFRRGAIAHPIKDNPSIVGETRVMSCGMACTVIEDNGANNITVRFDDGYIAYKKTRRNFIIGHIPNPNIDRNSIINQKSLMNCGMECTVIEDNGTKDITVQFEDGTIKPHCTRADFRAHSISNPSLGSHYTTISKASIVGQRLLQNCGMECTVIKDNGYKDITVKFEDGTIVNGRRDAFLNKHIVNPNFDATSIKGLTRIMNNGMSCTVIEDNGSEDITVKFEDGHLRFHCSRANFFKGKIGNPNLASGSSLPQAIIYRFIKMYFPDVIPNYRPDWLKNPLTGQNLEIDVWIPSKRVGIEYDGYMWHKEETTTSKCKYDLLVASPEIEVVFTILERGAIVHNSSKHINLQLDYQTNNNEYPLLLKQLEAFITKILNHLGINSDSIVITEDLITNLFAGIDFHDYYGIGKTKTVAKLTARDLQLLKSDECDLTGFEDTMYYGMSCKVIEDCGYGNITVQFEDGTIVDHLTRSAFARKIIINPTVDTSLLRINRSSILGQCKTMKCGMSCTVISDYGYDDISVHFEDGTNVYHRSRGEFKNRSIWNPSLKRNGFNHNAAIVGQSKIMSNGMMCTVIDDKGAYDITVQFEDGTIQYHKYRSAFKKGLIGNPNIKKGELLGERRKMNCGMECTVIEDNNSLDITVKFDDGTVVEHRSRAAFKKGSINNGSIINSV